MQGVRRPACQRRHAALQAGTVLELPSPALADRDASPLMLSSAVVFPLADGQHSAESQRIDQHVTGSQSAAPVCAPPAPPSIPAGAARANPEGLQPPAPPATRTGDCTRQGLQTGPFSEDPPRLGKPSGSVFRATSLQAGASRKEWSLCGRGALWGAPY